MGKDILLTIAVPTYNRAVLLDLCLSAFVQSLIGSNEVVEVIVSNNGSADNTDDVVAEYATQFDNFLYFKNEKNLGPDLNILQCFNKARGKYVWIFGDDDILLPNRLSKILLLLKGNSFGLLKLNPVGYYDNISEVKHLFGIDKLEYRKFEDSIVYFHHMHYWVTFITGVIFNKSVLKSDIDYQAFVNTNLIQVSWNIRILFAGLSNVIIDTPIVACKQDNSGGYGFISTFSKKYNFILKSLVKSGFNKNIISITNNNLIQFHFPHFLNKLLRSENEYQNENGFYILLKCFWKYPSFWKYILPIYLSHWRYKILLYAKTI